MPSINQIAAWQGNLQMGKETTYGTAALTANMKTIGVIGTPEIDTAPEFVDTGETGSGTSERLATEFAIGKKQAAFSFDTVCDEQRMYLFFRSLFQHAGIKTGTGPWTFKWNPWIDQPATNLGTTLQWSARNTEASGGVEMLGAIAEMVKWESSEGTFVKSGAKFRGTTATVNTPAAAGGGAWTGTKRHMHFDHVLEIPAATVVKPMKTSGEITNTLPAFYGTSQVPVDLAMGRFGLKGAFTLPLKGAGVTEMANFIAGTARSVLIKYHTPATAGFWQIACDVRFSAGKLSEENGLRTIDFEYIQAKGATVTEVTLVSATDLSL